MRLKYLAEKILILKIYDVYLLPKANKNSRDIYIRYNIDLLIPQVNSTNMPI